MTNTTRARGRKRTIIIIIKHRTLTAAKENLPFSVCYPTKQHMGVYSRRRKRQREMSSLPEKRGKRREKYQENMQKKRMCLFGANKRERRLVMSMRNKQTNKSKKLQHINATASWDFARICPPLDSGTKKKKKLTTAGTYEKKMSDAKAD